MAHLERGWTGRIMDVDFQVDVDRAGSARKPVVGGHVQFTFQRALHQSRSRWMLVIWTAFDMPKTQVFIWWV